MREPKRFHVYIMTNRPRSHVLYTGVTGKLTRRVFQHKNKLARDLPVGTTSRVWFITNVSFTPTRQSHGKKRYQAYHHVIPHHELVGVAVLFVVGIILIALSQPRPMATPSA